MKHHAITWIAALLICVAGGASPIVAADVDLPARPAAKADAFEGYDFGQVVTRVENSVDPLQREMAGSFKHFAASVKNAEQLLADSKPAEAVGVCAAAIDEVVASRDSVLNSMWRGQEYLAEQVAWVRDRLAKAVHSAGTGREEALDKRAEVMLDAAARRIATETDPQRKKRLVAHYRMLRQLAQTKAMARRLSPDQRKTWRSVLKVLDDTALAHQQVLMGTEVLFARFETAAANLNEYKHLLQTVEGASRLMGVARGLGDSGAGLAKLSESMAGLQERMNGFNNQVESMLQAKMIDLETQVDAVVGSEAGSATQAVPSEIDDELQRRMMKLAKPTELASKKGA